MDGSPRLWPVEYIKLSGVYCWAKKQEQGLADLYYRFLHLAKKSRMTWFKRNKDIIWFDIWIQLLIGRPDF